MAAPVSALGAELCRCVARRGGFDLVLGIRPGQGRVEEAGILARKTRCWHPQDLASDLGKLRDETFIPYLWLSGRLDCGAGTSRGYAEFLTVHRTTHCSRQCKRILQMLLATGWRLTGKQGWLLICIRRPYDDPTAEHYERRSIRAAGTFSVHQRTANVREVDHHTSTASSLWAP